MSSNWIRITDAVTIISKHSHHTVSVHHIRALVNRGKIGSRSSREGTTLLKRSDVEATRVAGDTGHGRRTDRAGTP
jgi:hypothetical protein